MNWETWFNVCNPLETLNLLLYLNSASGIDRLRKGTLSYPLVEWNRNTTVNKKIELKSWWLLLAGRPLGSYFFNVLSREWPELRGRLRSISEAEFKYKSKNYMYFHTSNHTPKSSGQQIFEPFFKREIWNGTEIVRVIDYQRTSWPVPSLVKQTFFHSSKFDSWPFCNQLEFRDVMYLILKV